MKKLGFLLLIFAATASAADLSLSWEIDWGWAGNFHDEYTINAEELELAVAADFGEYNVLFTELELENYAGPERYVGWNSFRIATDIGAYLGFPGAELIWENGFAALGGAEEYADFGIVGYAAVATDWADLTEDWNTCLTATRGSFWVSVATSWNLGLDSSDPAVVNADSERRTQLFAGAVDAVPGLSFEAGSRMDLDRAATTAMVDLAYTLPMDRISLTAGGSFATTDLSADDQIALYGLDASLYEQLFGFGLELEVDLDERTGFYTSVSFKGDTRERFRALGAGIGIERDNLGAEAAVSYDRTLSAGNPAFDGIDLSGYFDVDGAVFTLGCVVTDGYGWSNNSTAPLPSTGGIYMKMTADF